MKFYNEEKLLKLRNILIVTVLALLALLLFFRVYDNFAKQIKLVTSTIFPFILSFVIVYSLMPFIDMLSEKPKVSALAGNGKKSKKLNRNLAILIVLVIFFSIFIYIVLAFIPIVAKQLSSLIEFFLKNQDKMQKDMFAFLESNNIDLRDTIINSKEVIINNTLKVLNSSFSVLNSMFSLLFMTPIFTIMLIFSYDSIEKKVEEKLTEYGLKDWIGLIRNIDKSIGDYIIVTMKDSMIVGICSYIIFFFLKLEYSSLFALIIGIGNVIPFIGPFIGLIPVIMYAMTKSFRLTIMIIVCITILQTIEANIIKPWLTRASLKIHPITTLLVVLIGGALFGIGGAFIAIPVYIILKSVWIFCENKYFSKLKQLK